MKLSTTVFVDTPVDVDSLTDYTLEVITPLRHNQPETYTHNDNNTHVITITTTQNVDLLGEVVTVYKNNGEDLSEEDVYHTDYYKFDDEDCFEDTYIKQRKCFMEVTFTTSEDFNATSHTSPPDAHKYVIESIGNYLKERKVNFRWWNDFTPQLNTNLNGLDEFLTEYAKVNMWFRDNTPHMVTLSGTE